jgi:hypothetical protein
MQESIRRIIFFNCIWLTRSASDQIASDEDTPSETRLFSSENGTGHVEGALNDAVHVDNLEHGERDEYLECVNILDESRVILLFEIEKIFQEIDKGWLLQNILLG